MNLRFEPVLPSDAQRLANLLAGSERPFHHERRVDASWVRGRLEAGHFFGNDTRSFWSSGTEAPPLGYAILRGEASAP